MTLEMLIDKDGSYVWKMGLKMYVNKNINSINQKIKAHGYEFEKNLSDLKVSYYHPLTDINYRTGIDTSDLCNDVQI